jgi:hypothetical protein
MESKISRLESLARRRKGDHLCGYSSYSKYHGGKYDEGNFVVPWTKSAYNVDSDIFILGQDWNSEGNLSGPFNEIQATLGQIPTLQSNKNLKYLLNTYLNMEFSETYATDLFVFVKPGNMSAPIRRKDLLYSAREYAMPQIEIVNPKIVICLGANTYNALRSCCGTDRRRVSLPWDSFSWRDIDIFGVRG